MNQELLSICIPTRNRAGYLRDLLSAFAKQVEEDDLGPEDVAFYISDNCSDDETPEVIREFARQVPKAVCTRNPANIGGDKNILHVRTMGRGKYNWVVGDDELLREGALAGVLHLIHKHSPGLILAYNSRYELKLQTPRIFPDYKTFAQECIRTNVHALAEHSLISCNIYRVDCFDMTFAKETLDLHYPQLYGMVRSLFRNKATVLLPDFPIITVRESPPPAVDGVWIENLDAFWVEYFTWLREELQLPELDPHAPSEYARRALIRRMLRHPFRFVRHNWHALARPGAYLFVFNRLFRRGR